MQPDVELCHQASVRWTGWMMAGDFERAWRESDLITTSGLPDPNRFWTGESWVGKRVMIRCLHGLGDAIQFIRYAPLLHQTCTHLTVQSHPELVRLMTRVPGVDLSVTWNAGENWDMQMEVMELPRAFRTAVSTIPARVPYVQMPAAQKSGTFTVGLVWQSSAWNHERSVPFEQLTPLLQMNCKFVYLKEEAMARGWDVLDTATTINNLDLLISVDTMCAHLAGALGKTVWIMLPKNADWRWMEARSSSPWYPTATLFRQQERGDWNGVIERVCSRLSASV